MRACWDGTQLGLRFTYAANPPEGLAQAFIIGKELSAKPGLSDPGDNIFMGMDSRGS